MNNTKNNEMLEKNKDLNKKIKFNTGISFLKIFTMYLIVMTHILSHGKILESQNPGSFNYFALWFLKTITLSGVNTFAIISGYLMIYKKRKLSQVLLLWMQVMFYSIIFLLLALVFGRHLINGTVVLASFLPTIFNRYWYFTGYAIVIILSPFINNILLSMKPVILRIFVVVLVGTFTILPSLINKLAYFTQSGYNFFWIGIMYVLGAYYMIDKKFVDKIIRWPIFLYILSLLAINLHFYFDYKSNFSPFSPDGFFGYTSPFIVLNALLLLIIFSKIDIKSKRINSFITYLSATNFGVYLIHDNPLVRENVMPKLFSFIGNINNIILSVLAVILISLIFYLSLNQLDKVREALFKKLDLKSLTQRITKGN